MQKMTYTQLTVIARTLNEMCFPTVGLDALLTFPESKRPALKEALSVFMPQNYFAIYGSLAPGCPNFHKVKHLRGVWLKATIRGRYINKGWGAEMGFPAMVWEPDNLRDLIFVDLLYSNLLPSEWKHLDAFEGEEYQRILVPVELKDNSFCLANIYVLAQ